jgi:hypothetical protein
VTQAERARLERAKVQERYQTLLRKWAAVAIRRGDMRLWATITYHQMLARREGD